MGSTNFLEQFYEQAILPRYAGQIRCAEITWLGHDKVTLDGWAHYFTTEDGEYALLYEDFPDGEPFKDGLSHEVVMLGGQTSIELRFGDTPKQIPNMVGWFTLFKKH